MYVYDSECERWRTVANASIALRMRSDGKAMRAVACCSPVVTELAGAGLLEIVALSVRGGHF